MTSQISKLLLSSSHEDNILGIMLYSKSFSHWTSMKTDFIEWARSHGVSEKYFWVDHNYNSVSYNWRIKYYSVCYEPK